MTCVFESIGGYSISAETGLVTTIAAGTSSAGHLFSMRYVAPGTGIAMRLLALDVQFLLTTAFTAAQEVGFEVVGARSYTASPTGATAITIAANDGKARTAAANSGFVTGGDVRIANTGAMTAGTVTVDALPFAKGGYWAGAVGNQLGPWRYDFTSYHAGGLIFANNEGFIIRNGPVMGAAGVGKWKFTAYWDEGVYTSR